MRSRVFYLISFLLCSVLIYSSAFAGLCKDTFSKEHGYYACLGDGCSSVIQVYPKRAWKKLISKRLNPKLYEALARIITGTYYSCYVNETNGIATYECGSFRATASVDYTGNIDSFRIEGPISLSLNKKILMIAKKHGITLSPGTNMVPAFIKYIMEKTEAKAEEFYQKEHHKKLNREKFFLGTVSFITCLANNIDIVNLQLLDRLVKDFVYENFQ